MSRNEEVRLATRPVGWPREDDFRVVGVEIPAPGPGQVLLRTLFLSVDPYMRGRMNGTTGGYVAPFGLDEAMSGHVVGTIVESNADGWRAGDLAAAVAGWRRYSAVDAAALTRIDAGTLPPPAYLGVLGMTGFTAYVGLNDVGRLQAGETLLVSAGAGAVGSVACQLGRLKGCRVVAGVGSAAKARYALDELGCDAAIDHRSGSFGAQLDRACPEGVDVYFDNVGGEQLRLALARMRSFGRVVLCGMISQYNATEPPPCIDTLGLAVSRRLTLRGFIVSDHAERLPAFMREVGQLVRQGELRHRESVVRGLANAPRALIEMMRGDHVGKVVVEVDDHETRDVPPV